ncbi:MAG: hypothetical protein ACLPUT_02985 [Solirubrobacteraceae bacterium]
MAGAALAAVGHPSNAHFSILSHPRTGLAHIASASGLNPPPGAILGTVDGHSEIYAWQRSSEEVCVVDLQASGQGGIGCDKPSVAEAHGVTVALMPVAGSTLSVATLVPNGVKSVVYSDHSGASRTATVSRNVVAVEDPSLASIHYTLPDGTTETVAVPSQAGPSQPPTPSSSGTTE